MWWNKDSSVFKTHLRWSFVVSWRFEPSQPLRIISELENSYSRQVASLSMSRWPMFLRNFFAHTDVCERKNKGRKADGLYWRFHSFSGHACLFLPKMLGKKMPNQRSMSAQKSREEQTYLLIKKENECRYYIALEKSKVKAYRKKWQPRNDEVGNFLSFPPHCKWAFFFFLKAVVLPNIKFVLFLTKCRFFFLGKYVAVLKFSVKIKRGGGVFMIYFKYITILVVDLARSEPIKRTNEWVRVHVKGLVSCRQGHGEGSYNWKCLFVSYLRNCWSFGNHV